MPKPAGLVAESDPLLVAPVADMGCHHLGRRSPLEVELDPSWGLVGVGTLEGLRGRDGDGVDMCVLGQRVIEGLGACVPGDLVLSVVLPKVPWGTSTGAPSLRGTISFASGAGASAPAHTAPPPAFSRTLQKATLPRRGGRTSPTTTRATRSCSRRCRYGRPSRTQLLRHRRRCVMQQVFERCHQRWRYTATAIEREREQLMHRHTC